MDDNEDVWSLLQGLKLDDSDGTDVATHTFLSRDGNNSCKYDCGKRAKRDIGCSIREDNEKEQKESECEACGQYKLIYNDGQKVCLNCYVVQSRIIDSRAEWRYYGADDNKDSDPSRCGMPTNNLLPKSSLGSVIGTRKGENRDMKRIRMYQMWNAMPYWERTLYNVFDKLSNNTTNHGISTKILDDAKVLYKKASEKKISRGDNKEGLIASCIYYACLINKFPRSHKEIARMFHIEPVVLTKGIARFQTLMQINVDSSNPDDYIARFGSKLNLSFNTIQECKDFAKKLDELEVVSENAPTSVAAGAIYYFCIKHSIDITKKQIADVCEVSEVTITKCYKRLVKFKNLFE